MFFVFGPCFVLSIILLRKRDLVVLLKLCYVFRVGVYDLRSALDSSVIVTLPDNTHLYHNLPMSVAILNFCVI